MGYVEKRLEPGEGVVFRTRLHPVIFAGTVTFAAFVIAATTLIVVRNELTAATIAYLWLGAGLIMALGFASPLVRWLTSEFAVTTRRVLMRVGVVHSQRLEAPVNRVEDVSVDQTLWGRLLGYGTVRVVLRGDLEEVFGRVAGADALRDAVRRQGRATPPGGSR
jgi:uncharacterized membrane protein YdbT with pleckstrin-like domain